MHCSYNFILIQPWWSDDADPGDTTTQQNPNNSYREIYWTKLFVYIFCCIPDTDTAPVMPTWEAPLPILGDICAKLEQNLNSSYREIHKTTYLFTFSVLTMILIQPGDAYLRGTTIHPVEHMSQIWTKSGQLLQKNSLNKIICLHWYWYYKGDANLGRRTIHPGENMCAKFEQVIRGLQDFLLFCSKNHACAMEESIECNKYMLTSFGN